ncbi:MAG: HlyD family secretion protein [Parcubacteria group bacterium ADurb.Bin115]|nr:MAG: HlyD family secretion protein [Parcubacteria group bacterium ADurb.Bin115]HOD87027.1 HlyD family efflux transporter periplasmic adaptor subunit [bacterium]HQB76290.1 HlyD family efflux transporter periplasmic adaptor subunit [bacterium]HQO11271.1 HlyD family efflux transporter periplasmic adaptor subunit [bacterium]HQQ38194.1 HlyD family efflux transporter periplasmic adaptor subunit [bacterium]
MKKNLSLLAVLVLSLLFSGCGTSQPVAEPTPSAIKVKTQSLADSKEIRQDLEYPAIVSASTEAKLVAKSSGNLSGADFKVGDEVKIGQTLARIDDIGSSGFSTDGINSNQIKQAIIAVEQAQSFYQLARSNYENLLVSSAKDLHQAEIARDQAKNAQSHLNTTSEESLKSAELAYETAKIATEQARLSLLNRQKQMQQGSLDANDNADLAATAAVNTAGNVLTGINNLAAFDDNNVVSIAYRGNLGALDSNSYNQADNDYQAAKSAYDVYQTTSFSDISERLQAAIDLAEKVKKLADSSKYLFDKSIPSSVLPQSAATGVSLSGLQSAAASYQSQLNAVIGQARGAAQALANVALSNDSTLDALKQAYELAKKQEAIAQQNLNNLKAGNNSQSDQAGFSVSLAQNQYENLKVKLDSQILAAKAQMDAAQLQYNNALVALQSLYDIHSIVSPIVGRVTQKLANNGDTVSAGQVVAVVSQVDNLKVRFFVEPEYVLDMKLGTPVEVLSADGQSYAGLISSVAAQADNATKRFQVEVKLDDQAKPLLGTVVSVKLSLEKSVASGDGEAIVPLSSLEIGQNGNFIFLFEDGKARKVPVELQKVLGERAQIKVEAPADAILIIEGNKLLRDGDVVEASA